MSTIRSIARRFRPAMTLVIFAFLVPVSVLAQGDDAPRPMTFLDVQEMRRAGSWAISPDTEWMLYTVTTPDWQEASLAALRPGGGPGPGEHAVPLSGRPRHPDPVVGQHHAGALNPEEETSCFDVCTGA